MDAATRPVRIGLIGKYIELPDAYLSVVESLRHAGFHHGAKVEIDWIQSESVEGLLAAGQLAHLDGIVIPGGFGYRGVEGKIKAFTAEICLLEQPFVKDPAMNVRTRIETTIGKIGENVQVRRFVRFKLGDDAAIATASSPSEAEG